MRFEALRRNMGVPLVFDSFGNWLRAPKIDTKQSKERCKLERYFSILASGNDQVKETS